MDDESRKPLHSDTAYLQRIDQNMTQIRQMLAKVVNYMVEAETEVSEKMRRFIMYFHDLHDVAYLYESRGHPIPEHVKKELERCDDRFRHLLDDAHTDGGTFEKVRREMAGRQGNRWDHTRQLAKPKES